MNAVATIKPATTSIAAVVEQTPVVVLTDHDQRDAFYAHIQREVDAFEPDTSTEKGRKEIKSFAYKITRTKTAIDDAGKQLNEEARARINAVDAERRVVKEKLTALANEVRAPLTKWEADEDKRIEDCRAVIDRIKAAAVVTIEDTAVTVRARGAEVWNIAIDADKFRDMAAEATAAKEMAVSTLKSALARLTKEEADRAELERLRAEAAEREERDRIEREAREAEERRAAEAKAAEEKRIADERAAEEHRVAAEKAEAERIERAKQEAAAAAERAAKEERAKRDREHAEQIAAERRRAEEAERKAQAERDHIAAEEAKRQAEAKRLADEQAARDADREHRGLVMSAAKAAIMTCGVDEDAAKKIVLLIRSGEVPNVTLRF
ncbi:MAG: hypothetical protein B7Y36_19025 [Novosphingobium sp. 28-62-57]|uniref:hypothetical protein n=1 Tax=Novosphingobium sp. 28-62-57 TaxID=1970409 RepID=UPI000BDC601B|nr:hypothetical protein [Novosphingobium sp. 28-62-57]OYZ07675.1 MAG: hypothetical protein B7Y36_19025 [Novosphingobium sp. 28-62-57]HQS98625.1 hypothetical protein [Novosphingobium sp.]